MTLKPLPNHSAPHRRIHLRAGSFTAIDFTLGLFEFGGCVGWQRFEYRNNGPNAKDADPSNLDSSKGIVNLAPETAALLSNRLGGPKRSSARVANSPYFSRLGRRRGRLMEPNKTIDPCGVSGIIFRSSD
jgi:hypothetical protein